MKTKLILGLASAMALAGSAFAVTLEEWTTDCEAFKAANPGANADCGCMYEQASVDDALIGSMMATETVDDVATLSEEALAIIEACTESAS